MAKKIWYSKPLAHQWDLYNESYKKHPETVDQFITRVTSKIESNPFESWGSAQLQLFNWGLWYSDAKKELLHIYFADKRLKEFLENVPLADLEGIEKYVKDNGFFTKQGLLELDYFPFGIHVPYENPYKAYAFGLMNNQFNQLVLSWTVKQGGAWLSEMNYKKLLQQDDDNAKEMTKIFQLAINTIAYMEAFPECVKEGVPELIKEPGNGKSFTLGLAEKVLEPVQQAGTGKMMTPHFRKGYYKRLSSDFYKNKKGQIIFVSETMVNGKAKTIYPAENIDEISSLDLQ